MTREQNGELKSRLSLDQEETPRESILINFLNATGLIIDDSECGLETLFPILIC